MKATVTEATYNTNDNTTTITLSVAEDVSSQFTTGSEVEVTPTVALEDTVAEAVEAAEVAE